MRNMRYNKELYSKVRREFDAKRLNHLNELDQRREEVYRKCPRICEIEQEIEQNGMKLAQLAIRGQQDVEELAQQVARRNAKLVDEKKTLLHTNGFAEDYMTNVWDCAKCEDKGEFDFSFCDCFQKRMLEKAYEQSNMARMMQQQTFENFRLDFYSDRPEDGQESVSPRAQMKYIAGQCMQFAQQFERDTQRSLFMFGPTGQGKTFLSSCIAKVVMDRGYTVLYQTAGTLFSMIADSKFASYDAPVKMDVENLHQCDLLIIDDVGTEVITQYTVSVFFELLNSRMVSGKKMVLNSNLSLKELQDIYSQRIASRIAGFEILRFIGTRDIRLMK